MHCSGREWVTSPPLPRDSLQHVRGRIRLTGPERREGACPAPSSVWGTPSEEVAVIPAGLGDGNCVTSAVSVTHGFAIQSPRDDSAALAVPLRLHFLQRVLISTGP